MVCCYCKKTISGGVTMDQSILDLYRRGKIIRQTALEQADNPEQLLRRMG